jgi:hypothetical protein
MGTYKDHPFYTHQPFFIEVLKNTTGDILECGCGDGSTVMIKEQIKGTPRKLVSLESNLEWLNKYTHLADESHKLYHVNTSNDDTIEVGMDWVKFIKNNNLTDFEVVFLDSSPWESRHQSFRYFLDKAKIIIIHDFDYFPNRNIIGKTVKVNNFGQKEIIECDLSDDVKHYKLFYPPLQYFAGNTGPPTLVCSNIMDKDEFNALIYKIESNITKYY